MALLDTPLDRVSGVIVLNAPEIIILEFLYIKYPRVSVSKQGTTNIYFLILIFHYQYTITIKNSSIEFNTRQLTTEPPSKRLINLLDTDIIFSKPMGPKKWRISLRIIGLLALRASKAEIFPLPSRYNLFHVNLFILNRIGLYTTL